jgi:hypothetical protein
LLSRSIESSDGRLVFVVGIVRNDHGPKLNLCQFNKALYGELFTEFATHAGRGIEGSMWMRQKQPREIRPRSHGSNVHVISCSAVEDTNDQYFQGSLDF